MQDIAARAAHAPPLTPHITARCTGCGRCVAACPPRVLWLEPRGWDKKAVLHDPARCTGCADCVAACPVNAVKMRRAAPVAAQGLPGASGAE